MLIPGIVLFVVGFLLAIAGGFWTLILAFSDNIVWGLASFFIPFVSLIYIIIKWSNKSVRKSFFLGISGWLIIFLGGSIVAKSGAFSNLNPTFITSDTDIELTESFPLSSSPAVVLSPATESPSPVPTAQDDSFRQAVNAAMSAAVITQSAISKDDWYLVVSRWESAIILLKNVPESSPNYTRAQAKIQEYERNMNYAQDQFENQANN